MHQNTDKYAYQRLPINVTFKDQLLVSFLMCFLPFLIVSRVVNLAQPKPGDFLIGTGALLASFGAGYKVSKKILHGAR